MNSMHELEGMKNDYLNKKAILSEQTIAADEQIKTCIQSGINELKVTGRKVSLLTVSCILMLSFVMFYNSLELVTPLLKYSTIAIVAIYIAFILDNRSSHLEKLYEKDVNSFVSGVKRQRKLQYWIIRIYFVVFFFWAGYMITLPLANLESVSEKLTLVAVLLPIVMVNLVVTVRFHNEIIGSYEGLVLAAERPEVAETLNDWTKDNESRRLKSLKRKHTVCIVMIILEAIGFVWEGIRVINGKGIIATLSIYAAFLVLFIILASAARKEMKQRS